MGYTDNFGIFKVIDKDFFPIIQDATNIVFLSGNIVEKVPYITKRYCEFGVMHEITLEDLNTIVCYLPNLPLVDYFRVFSHDVDILPHLKLGDSCR